MLYFLMSIIGVTMVEGYCMKCKKKSEMKNAKEVVGKNGRVRVEGKCTKCDCKICTFVKTPKKAS